MVLQSLHQALDRDAILRAISSFYGITTADGNLAGTTLFCSTLIGSNDFITNKMILLQSGASIYQDRGATGFNPLTGQITVSPAFGSQVLAGTSFYVLNASSAAMLAALVNLVLTRIGDPSAHTLTSLTAKLGDIARSLDLILGSRWDAAGDLGTDIAAILAALGPSGQGLVYYGVVTAIPGANQFTIPTLAGLGAGKFNGATSPYQAFVFRDAGGAGAAPQGEMQPVTAYNTATGDFTTAAYTVAVAIGDEILILNPRVAEIFSLVTRLGDPSAHILNTITAKWGNIARSLTAILGPRWDAAGNLGTDIATIILASGGGGAGGGIPSTILQGLFYYGVVTAIPGANQFRIPTLSGLGAAKFANTLSPYRAYVLRDAGGAAAAPQGETQIITAYADANGDFTTNPFTAAVAVGDEILIIHPALVEARALTTGTYAHQNNVNEQDALIFAGAMQRVLVRFDVNALTQNTTIREYEQVDGANYRELSAKVFPTDFDTGCKAVSIDYIQTGAAYKITFQSAVLEGAIRNIPYRYTR